FSIAVWMIGADRRRPGRAIWLLIPITIIWTNLHGGFAVLIAVIGLTAVGSALERGLEWYKTGALDWKTPGRYVGLLIGCGAATRHITLYSIAAAPLIAAELTGVWLCFAERSDRRSIPGILNQISADLARGFRRSSVIWVPAFVVTLVLIDKPVSWPTDFLQE